MKRDVREATNSERANHRFKGMTLSSESGRETEEAGKLAGC